MTEATCKGAAPSGGGETGTAASPSTPPGGLSRDAARRKFLQYGPNRIYEPEELSFFRIARHEVSEPMILLLLVVGVFYSIWGKLPDAVTIFAIIILLVFAEVYNEYRAKKAIASLGKVSAPRAKVGRDGEIIELDTEEVVPGDLLILTSGTKVSADARLTDTTGLQVDEATLTGESVPVDKKRDDEVYAGTVVLSGEGTARVVATGKKTRLGHIASSLEKVSPPRTPLQLAMKALVKKLVFVALFFSIIIPVVGILEGHDVRTMILTGLSLSFATIPEELPIIITMVLGVGSYTLSRRKFLIKKLRGAETLGNATVIVTDKTGTITEAEMRLSSIYPPEKKEEIIRTALGTISDIAPSPMEKEIKKNVDEQAVAAQDDGPYRQRNVGETERKTKATIREEDGSYILYLSGAPEEVFERCRDIPPGTSEEMKKLTGEGKRVIAVASKSLAPDDKDKGFDELERDLEFAGLVAFEDPPREGIADTVAAARRAGIRTVMVTGDHASTASFIAREVSISTDHIKTGRDLDHIPDSDLKETVKEASVFARTTPQHKYRIVKALQENGEVVAVTGDGVNDVLALKGADIGIAMGIKGTDVAKDAADVVLADDNYLTITRGIFEGRKFFDNLRKGIKYYLSVKTALVMIFLLPVILGVSMPFSPIQIIILELFMDLAASAGFVAEPGEDDIYTRPPRDRNENVLSARVVRDIFLNGFVLFFSVMAVYFYAHYRNLGFHHVQTFAFSAWIFGHVILAFVSRAEREPVVRLGLFTNKVMNVWAVSAVVFLAAGIYLPFLRDRFNLAEIPPADLAAIAAAVLIMVGSLEVRKYVLGESRSGGA